MKISLSVNWNPDFAEIAAITLPRIQSYALRHGYSLFSHLTFQSSPEIVWQRVKDLRLLLSMHDLAVHIDADVLITNPDVTIESLTDGNPSDCFMSQDWNGINDGFCIWRDSWGSLSTLKRLLESANAYTSPQDALSHDGFAPELSMHKFPQALTNSYMTLEYGDLRQESEWKPGHFALHLPGLSNHRRVEILNEMTK